jgi:hypothetical protein
LKYRPIGESEYNYIIVDKPAIEYRILRRMKYISDQQGIIERYLEEHEGWKNHLERTRSFILDCVRKSTSDSVIIMGSGWLLDVPLKELVTISEHLYLADIWHPRQVRAMVQKYPGCNLIYTDLTGGAVNQIYSLVKSFRKSGIRVSLGSISYDIPELPDGNSYLISLNILNQLDIILVDYIKRFIKYPEDEIMDFRKKIQENHLALLKPGHSCLIVDQEEIISDNKNQVVSTKKPVYAELPEGQRRLEWKWNFDKGGAFNKGNMTEFNVIAIEL